MTGPPRCDDCGRPVRAVLHIGPDGRKRGDKCHRKAARHWRRLRLPALGRIRRMPPGDDQLPIDLEEE